MNSGKNGKINFKHWKKRYKKRYHFNSIILLAEEMEGVYFDQTILSWFQGLIKMILDKARIGNWFPYHSLMHKTYLKFSLTTTQIQKPL